MQLLTRTLEMANFDIFRTQYRNSPDRARFDFGITRVKLTTFLIINEIVTMSIWPSATVRCSRDGTASSFSRYVGRSFSSSNQIPWLFWKCSFRIPNKVKHASFIIIMLFYGGFEYMTSENGSVPAGSFTLTNEIFGYFQKVSSNY